MERLSLCATRFRVSPLFFDGRCASHTREVFHIVPSTRMPQFLPIFACGGYTNKRNRKEKKTFCEKVGKVRHSIPLSNFFCQFESWEICLGGQVWKKKKKHRFTMKTWTKSEECFLPKEVKKSGSRIGVLGPGEPDLGGTIRTTPCLISGANSVRVETSQFKEPPRNAKVGVARRPLSVLSLTMTTLGVKNALTAETRSG